MLKKPVRLSLARQMMNAMEDYIRIGKWAIGEKIPAEPELTKIFAVSHNTVREAVQSLIHAGILQARPGDGTYVIANDRFAVAMSNKLKETELPKILEARLALEKEIVRLAALNRTTKDLNQLEQSLRRCQDRSQTGIENDMTFHAHVATATHNPVLSELYNVIINYIKENLGSLLSEKQYDPIALQWHHDLLKAIRQKQPDEASQIIEKIVAFDSEALD